MAIFASSNSRSSSISPSLALSRPMAHHFQQELAFLGVESSPAFVRAPEGPVSFADIPCKSVTVSTIGQW